MPRPLFSVLALPVPQALPQVESCSGVAKLLVMKCAGHVAFRLPLGHWLPFEASLCYFVAEVALPTVNAVEIAQALLGEHGPGGLAGIIVLFVFLHRLPVFASVVQISRFFTVKRPPGMFLRRAVRSGDTATA